MPTYLVSALVCVPNCAGPTLTWGHRATIIAAPTHETAKGYALEKFMADGRSIRDIDATELTECPGFIREVAAG